MEQSFPRRLIKIIKSTEDQQSGNYTEQVYKICIDEIEVLKALAEIEHSYSKNPDYERLHGAKDYLSAKFRNIHTHQEICFLTGD
ncbi:hypothetical protein LZQ00_05510 [Sphingobacterium sp. SRCM116780]|uniref:hypothetical protein n=1 Tax=Sphingobacterium sp. SRCM116780 TaxID=2907623 RepID=UPI001F3F49C3|nr:hypothetical protein [Sphingobacterium sp. SRCM116780]UIR57271.1 hypothetical protein LZQ00_05510 [Sphingobacterium sp. SRCM116780]